MIGRENWLMILLLAFFGQAVVSAEENTHPKDITTTAGKTYSGVKVNKIEPDGVSIFHSGGVAKVKFDDLSPELQKHFGYDREKAAAFAKAEAERQAKLRAEAERRRKIAELGSSVMKAEQKKNLIAQEEAAKADADYQSRFAQRMKVKLLIKRYLPDGKGAVASYSKAKRVTESYMSGAIRRERSVIRWSDYSNGSIFVRGLAKQPTAVWEGVVMPDGTTETHKVGGKHVSFPAYEILDQTE